MARSNELSVPMYGLDKFTWSDSKLVAEASDLGRFNLGQLWNDSADAGIGIRSHRTGRVERFYVSHIEEREGDLLTWELEPVNPNCRVKKVVVFND